MSAPMDPESPNGASSKLERARVYAKLVEEQAATAAAVSCEYSIQAFDRAAVSRLIDPDHAATIEVPSGSQAYGLLLSHIGKEAKNATSFRLKRQEEDSDDDSDDEGGGGGGDDDKLSLTAGLGVFELADLDGEPVVAVHQVCGPPVASACGGPERLHSIVLLAREGRAPALKALVAQLIERAERHKPNTFNMYCFIPKQKYWRREGREVARPLDSVVLPEATKAALVQDIDEFLSPATSRWYATHGIPHKRSYLFYGVPGAGKTSLIQAVAGRFQRDVAFLQPTHPDMTDDALKAAIQRAPKRSVIVLEDVDALFNGRTKLAGAGASPLTFSGLLNALDGVGGAGGRLFVLTTNHRENLDPALIRSGRVDLHVRFDYVVDEQLRGLFRQFYPDCAPEQPEQFAAAVRAVLGGREVAACAVQSLFIKCRRASAAEAISRASIIADELDSRAGDELQPLTSAQQRLANVKAGAGEESEEE